MNNYCSIETIGIKKDYPNSTNLLLELNLLNEKFFLSELNTPMGEISIEAMVSHNISNKILKEKKIKNFKDNKSFKELFKLSNKKESDNYLIVWQETFFREILEISGISFENFKIIDIKQILSHLLLSDYKFIIEKPLKNINLEYIKYLFDLEEEVLEEEKRLKIKDKTKTKQKVLLLRIIFNYIQEKWNINEKEMLSLSKKEVKLKFLFSKDKIVKFEELKDFELFYYSKSFDRNIKFTSLEVLKERGVNLEKNLITSGKYSGEYIEDIEDIEYLEWFSINMTHLNEDILNSIKNRIVVLRESDNEENEYPISIFLHTNKIVLEGELPSNIRSWLEKQPFVEIGYKKCKFILTSNNLIRQETILDKIKNCVKVIKIEKVNND